MSKHLRARSKMLRAWTKHLRARTKAFRVKSKHLRATTKHLRPRPKMLIIDSFRRKFIYFRSLFDKKVVDIRFYIVLYCCLSDDFQSTARCLPDMKRFLFHKFYNSQIIKPTVRLVKTIEEYKIIWQIKIRPKIWN